jgi:hypothetical protein
MFIFDIDGVLADVTHLLPLIDQSLPKDKRDYDQYYSRIGEALPIEPALLMCADLLNTDNGFIFLTGRSERCRSQTLAWLNYQLPIENQISRHDLWMRKDGDERPAHEVKGDLIAELIANTGIETQNLIVFEDDRRCVEMYKQLGCYVCHVKHDKARS